MNSEMQILRWGIPGWITLLTYIILVLSINNFDVFEYASANTLEGGYLAGMTAILVAVGVPLGYIIYQVYFFAKWKYPKKNIDLIFKELDLYKTLRKKNRKISWNLVERTTDAYITMFGTSRVNYKDIIRRYDSFKSRTDRVHGLGATIWGIVLSWISFTSIHLFVYEINVINNTVFIFTSVMLFILVLILINNYFHSDKSSYYQLSKIAMDIQNSVKK